MYSADRKPNRAFAEASQSPSVPHIQQTRSAAGGDCFSNRPDQYVAAVWPAGATVFFWASPLMAKPLPAEEWAIFGEMDLGEYVAFLRRLASKVDFTRYPKAHRGPKKPKSKRKYDPEHPHVSVAKLVLARKLKESG